MADLDHGPNKSDDSLNSATIARNVRVGLVLFGVYLAMYVAFVLINAFRPDWMDVTPLGGVNLAIWYGFGLIVVALILALIYGFLCRTTVEHPGGKP